MLRYEPAKASLIADETGASPVRSTVSNHASRWSWPKRFRVNTPDFPLAKVVFKDSSFSLDSDFIPPFAEGAGCQAASGDAATAGGQRFGRDVFRHGTADQKARYVFWRMTPGATPLPARCGAKQPPGV